VDSLPNQTSIVVVGKLLPYNASEYLNPEPNYGGTILVQVIESAATTQSATVVTAVVVSGTLTSSVVQTQSFPGNYQTMTVNGVLIRTYGGCVTPLASASPVPQYVVGVALVLGIIGSIIAYNRFRKS
jgi:protein-S-isoprenylcysteine O-methyltransferase Ste14